MVEAWRKGIDVGEEVLREMQRRSSLPDDSKIQMNRDFSLATSFRHPTTLIEYSGPKSSPKTSWRRYHYVKRRQKLPGLHLSLIYCSSTTALSSREVGSKSRSNVSDHHEH
jgi:hypothetical protein